MSIETASLPFNLDEGYEALDGPSTGSASESLTLAHAKLQTILLDRGVADDLRRYGTYIDELIATIELFGLPADATIAAVRKLLLVPPVGKVLPPLTYNLLACLVQTMTALEATYVNTLTEYVAVIVDRVCSDMLEDEVRNRKLRPGLLDAIWYFGAGTSTIQ